MTIEEVRDIYQQEYDSYVADVDPSATKYQWAAAQVFDIYTDDVDIDEGITQHIIEVCKVITGRISHGEYFKDEVSYGIYMLICQFLRHWHWIRWDRNISHCWFTDDVVDYPDHIIDNEIYPDDGGVVQHRVPFSEKNLMALIDWIEDKEE